MTNDKVFGVDLGSIVESLYLEIPFTENIRDYNIIVNPMSVSYIIRKTVIINTHEYPEKNIDILKKNECNIISRIFLGDDIKFSPYLIRMIPRIVWNGKEEETPDSWTYSSDKLQFPKLKGEVWRGVKGEYDYLGFLCHQVGIHVYPGPYQDLDLVKTEKGKW